MTNKAAKTKNNLRHRFAQMLLGSPCAAIGYSDIKQASISSPEPQLEDNADCGIHDELRRRKLDKSSEDCFAPCIAPAIRASIDCSARRYTNFCEPFISLTRRVEKNEKAKDKKPTALYEAIKNEQKKFSPVLLSSCTRNTSSFCSYRGEGGAKNKKKISHLNKVNGKEKETMRLLPNAYGVSSSSCDNDTGHGFYSSEDEGDEEEESAVTLFSPRSLSSDSSEFYRSKRKNNGCNNNKKKSRRTSMKCTRGPARPLSTRGILTPQKDYWDASDKLRPLVSYSSAQKAETNTVAKPESSEAETEKAENAEYFPVVKRSRDPYMDFRSSMVEIIVERRINSTKDLEGLLLSYLCLNSALHHPVIVEAYRDIWEAIFCCSD